MLALISYRTPPQRPKSSIIIYVKVKTKLKENCLLYNLDCGRKKIVTKSKLYENAYILHVVRHTQAHTLDMSDTTNSDVKIVRKCHPICQLILYLKQREKQKRKCRNSFVN